jgi:hypothetical protein
MNLRPAQIILTEGGKGLISRSIQRFTRSKVTHALLVTADNVAVEAYFPKVREVSFLQRIKDLQQQDRAFVVLDLPRLALPVRKRVVREARSFIGRRYDVAQIGLFALTGQFWNDGPRRLVCSRLITAAYQQAGVSTLFPERVIAHQFAGDLSRQANIRAGYVTPADLLKSRLEVVHFSPSTTVATVGDFLSLP